MSGSRTCCCCCCILFIVLIFAALILVFVFRERLGPSLEAHYKVSDASLSQFSMGSGNKLDYNLAVNMTVENPSKLEYVFEKFDAEASYDDEDLNEVSLKEFELGKSNTSRLSPLVFKGQSALKGDAISKIKGGTVFDVELKIKVKLSARAGKIDLFNEYKVECHLKVPLINPKGKSEKFESTECKDSGSKKKGIKM